MNCVQFFLAANLVCTEAMADEKIELILQSHELRGVPVGSTHQNLQGFNMFSSLLADKILEDQIHELEEQTFLGMQSDAAYSSNMRITQAAAVWDIIRSSVLQFKA